MCFEKNNKMIGEQWTNLTIFENTISVQENNNLA